MPCHNCNNTQKICGCEVPTCTPVECGCPVYITSDCVNNVKAIFECSEIETGLSLTETLEQLDAFICEKVATVTNYLTIVNVGTGAEVYKGISGIGQKQLRTIVSTSDFITVSEEANEIEFSLDEDVLSDFIQDQIEVEVNNQGGTGASVLRDVVENPTGTFTIRGKKIKSSDNSVTITQTDTEVDLTTNITPVTTVIEAGDNVNITGVGTSVDPYIINATDTIVELQDGTTTEVNGNGVTTPYSVEIVNLQKTISSFPYTLQSTDDKYTIFIQNAGSNVVINVPNGLVDNFSAVFIQEGTGEVAIQQSGSATLLYPSTTLQNAIKGQYFWAMVEKKLNTNTYYLLGSLKTI